MTQETDTSQHQKTLEHSSRILIWAIVLGGLLVLSQYNFLLFHALAEIYAITIAFAIFILVSNARHFLRNDFLVFIGIGFLFVGLLDLLHTLSYKNMGVFPGYDANYPTQLWIAARYLQSFILLAAPLFLSRRIDVTAAFSLFALLTIFIIFSIFTWEIFPDSFIEGSGLTPFKVYSEYLIVAIHLAAIIHIYRHRSYFEPRILFLMIAALFITAVSELAFTTYTGVYDITNAIGHLFKITAFYLIYLAIIEVGFHQPYNLLFRELYKRHNDLEAMNEKLKNQVYIDCLTGASNRFRYEETINQQWRVLKREGKPLSLIMADVDFFKDYNDFYGHQSGDYCLQSLVYIMNKQLHRPADMLVRYGGEEFVIILPNTDLYGAKAIAEKLQEAVKQLAIIHEKSTIGKWVTLSFGVATMIPSETHRPDDLLGRADKALYQAKAQGRNRIETYQ